MEKVRKKVRQPCLIAPSSQAQKLDLQLEVPRENTCYSFVSVVET
tara:strand:+ start:537 stop:671 length:135 start_codon:yes stop_codon:yes gene_type:complete